MRLICDEIAGAAQTYLVRPRVKFLEIKTVFGNCLESRKFKISLVLGLVWFSFFKSVPKCIDTKSSKYRHP